VALEGSFVFVDYVEAGGHGFVVGDAVGVVAFDQSDEFVGESDGTFADDGEVAYFVEHDIGSDEGDAVDGVFFKELVGDFDKPFAPHFAAGEVVADGDGIGFEFVEFKQVGDFEELLWGDVVDGSAVFECGYFAFFNHSRLLD